jgi:outer membrane protein, heavy metal efflux system
MVGRRRPATLSTLALSSLVWLLPTTGAASDDGAEVTPASPVGASGAAAAGFRPHPQLRLQDLERVAMDGDPELEAAQLQVDLARAQVRQSRMRPNPTLDLEYGTIPLGRTNPPNLPRPFANVPNYGVGVSVPVPLAKRRPRIRQAQALERAAQAELEVVARSRAFALAETLGELAAASLRREGFEQMVADTERSITVASQRVALSYGVPLEVDQLGVELARIELQVRVARGDIAQALADCAAVVGSPCQEFASSTEARAYLDAWIGAAATEAAAQTPLEERPDLRALAEHTAAAEQARALARAQRIPDPSFRLGFLHDRFLESGNHMNSLSASLSLPLPVFDRGQAQMQAAQAQARRLASERSKRAEAARSRIPALAQRVDIERERQAKLRDEAIPAAKAIVRSLEEAAERRLTSITELVHARRAMRELLLEEAAAYDAAYRARLELLRELAPPPETLP